MLVYAGLLLLSVGVGVVYYEFIQPRLGPKGATLPRQTLGLGLFGGSMVAGFFTLALLFGRVRPLERWWQAGGSLLLLAISIGVLCYILTTVYGRSLAIAVLPSFSRGRPTLVARRRPKLHGDEGVAVVATHGQGNEALPSVVANCLSAVEEISEVVGPEQ
jgi:hypothetical protein